MSPIKTICNECVARSEAVLMGIYERNREAFLRGIPECLII